MTTPRRRFTHKVYRDLRVKQDWKCACCDEPFYQDGESRIGPLPYHFDHVFGLELGGKDEPENLQALKRGHHQRKTDRETTARAKTKRIQAQDGLRRKKPSKRDLVDAKVLER